MKSLDAATHTVLENFGHGPCRYPCGADGLSVCHQAAVDATGYCLWHSKVYRGVCQPSERLFSVTRGLVR